MTAVDTGQETAGGWPDPARPGVPLNPERDGWHCWVSPDGEDIEAHKWRAAGHWAPGVPPENVARSGFTYLGPCLAPAEITAREAAAWCAGRDVAARWHDERFYLSDAPTIRALQPPPDLSRALDAVREEARREERETCAALCERSRHSEGWMSAQGRNAARVSVQDCADRIRQRGEGGGA